MALTESRTAALDQRHSYDVIADGYLLISQGTGCHA